MLNNIGSRWGRQQITLGVLVAIALMIINVDLFHFDRMFLWAKVTVSVPLLCGLVGTVSGIRLLRFVGWLGILMFFFAALRIAIPDEDYFSGGPDGPQLSAPRVVSDTYMFARMGVAVLITLLLVWFYRKSWVKADTSSSTKQE